MATWEELLGSNNWKGLLKPNLDPNLREFILRCGDFCQATYDAFNDNDISPNCGNSRYGIASFFHNVILRNAANYQVIGFLYATSGSHGFCDMFFCHPPEGCDAAWDRESNWMGYVAISTDEHSQDIGRREIYVAWRGTQRTTEWTSNVLGAWPVSAQPLLRQEGDETNDDDSSWFSWLVDELPKVHGGWLSICTSEHPDSKFTSRSVRSQVNDIIRVLVRNRYKDENPTLVMVGHSLGGALANLSAFDLVENGAVGSDVRVSSVIFGCPQVGNELFMKRVKGQRNLKILHVKNVKDLVPRLPDSGWRVYDPIETCALEINSDKSPCLKPSLFDVSN
ncbi:Fungal lipase-like domain containing protein [Trema orientale]|uniref:Phospholipase A1 n=1 Tax=Trema orientale TaxID=63057 RepID=A0A2P5FF80_TREOI|nr:Fungal lipase-like domain containing protein [Trema orientale]